ncbi:MAG: right-handed parallel beta-helix repeat-containing protein [bacterium]|nr:right-handed parallel beta-helix repeat-containing protein [bacterium]
MSEVPASTAAADSTTAELVNLRNAYTRVWEVAREVETTLPGGRTAVETVKSRICEKASGLCYKDAAGEWVPSVPEWRETADRFVIDRCGYGLFVGKTVGTGVRYAIYGEDVAFRPARLAISNGADEAQLATLTADAQGFIVPGSPSVLRFANAFGPGYDLEYVAEKDGFHQNLVIWAAPSAPLGLAADSCEFEIWTEVGLDSYLSAADAQIVIGTQVALDVDGVARVPAGPGTPIEFCSYHSSGQILSWFLADSPVWDGSAEPAPRRRTCATRELRRDAESGKVCLVERLPIHYFNGAEYPVVLDFVSKNGDFGGVEEWTPENTYYISGDLNISGTVTILPGTVVKLKPGVSINLVKVSLKGQPVKRGKVIARGEPYDYIVFTNAADNTCGQPIDPPPPSGRWERVFDIYAGSSPDTVIQYCKLGHGQLGIYLRQVLNQPVSHNIFRDMYSAIQPYGISSFQFHNNLVAQCTSYAIYAYNVTDGDYTNNTIDCAGAAYSVGLCDQGSTYLTATDNLFSNCHTGLSTNNYYYSVLDHNGFWRCTTPVSGAQMGPNSVVLGYNNNPYDPCSVGEFYLNWNVPGGGSLRDWQAPGAPSPRSAEAAGLLGEQFTVNKPNAAPALITSNVTWGKIATDTGIVDIGYHHNRVDHVVDDIDTVVYNGALTIEPGTVVGIHGQDRWIWVDWCGRVILNGNLYTGDCPLICSKRCVSMGIESAHKDASVCPGGNPNDGQIGLLLLDYSGFSSQILGVIFRGLYVGVSSNMRTPEPIANNRFFACFLGVDVWDLYGDGLPDVRNNLFYDNFRAIQVASFYPGTRCTVRNNTVDRCGGGVKVYGSEYQYEEFWPWVFIHDNLFTYTSPNYAIDGMEHWRGAITHNGFWGNDQNYPAWMEVTDSAPITSHPYEGDGQPHGRWYLDQDCGAVDAGSVAACTSTLNLYTTCTDARYDQLMADVGIHYPNPDGPQNPSSSAPTINIESPAPYQLVTGDCLVEVSVEDTLGPTPGIDRVEFYVDYQPAGMLSEGRPRHTWQSHQHGNGTHLVQAVAIDFDGEVATSAPVTVDADNLVHSFRISRQEVENFGGGSGPLYFEGLVKPGATWSAYVLDEHGATVRNLGSGASDGFTGAWYGEKDDGQAVDGGLYTLEVEASEQCFQHVCCVNDVPWDECMLLIFAPIADNEYDKELVEPVIDCARARNIPYRVHYGQSANWYWLSNILRPDDTTACQYFYISAHGGRDFYGSFRTAFRIADGRVYSDITGVNHPPDGGPAYSLADLGLAETTKMKFVWVDACNCGHPAPFLPQEPYGNNDMAWQFGISSEHWTPDYDQCYLAFSDLIPEPSAPDGAKDRQYTKEFWDRLAVNYYVSQAYESICWLEPLLWHMTYYSRPDYGQYVCPHAVVLPMHP